MVHVTGRFHRFGILEIELNDATLSEANLLIDNFKCENYCSLNGCNQLAPFVSGQSIYAFWEVHNCSELKSMERKEAEEEDPTQFSPSARTPRRTRGKTDEIDGGDEGENAKSTRCRCSRCNIEMGCGIICSRRGAARNGTRRHKKKVKKMRQSKVTDIGEAVLDYRKGENGGGRRRILNTEAQQGMEPGDTKRK
ncbi:hypothetical protein L2E82_51614 [Cichorium intybus]|nr:hypothetical protein L2E82_51614 [Cichorium intybus]